MKDELREIYTETQVPEELSGVVEAALRRGGRKARSKRRALRIVSPIAAAFAAFVLVRFLDVNIVFIILGCAGIGLAEGLLRSRLERRRA